MASNYYEILGVSKDAKDEEIKAAYRSLAKKYHPDLYSTKSEAEKKAAEEKFKEINHAYQVLTDPQKRAAYDQYGSEDGPQFTGGAGGGFSGFDGFGDIFSNIFSSFGGRRTANPNAPRRGDDILLRVAISFFESVRGVHKDLNYKRRETCSTCGGSGAKKGSVAKNCSRCGGTGTVRVKQNSLFGQIVTESVCPDCKGKGKIITDVCKDCSGTGFILKQRVLSCDIIAGMSDGRTMIYRGQGNAGENGGPSGDIQVEVTVRSHPLYNRRENDLYIEMPIPFAIATLGGEVDVPTPYGPYKYKIPEGTQTGQVFKIKGKGMKYIRKEVYGDLYVTVKVVTPTKLTKAQKESLSTFAQSISSGQQESIRKFYDSAKE
ncbi:MAG: molecular chaperone DnaJ [Clostridia bacterium]|nr:molecular chaperone DnaJ [Clostridia bacterium]